MNNVIELRDVKKSYGKGNSKVDVLKGVSLTIQQGEFVSLLGPSGSGKSTLMNCIGLIDNIDSGLYHLDGIDIKKQNEHEYATLRSKKIGFVFQKFNLIAGYSVVHNVALPLLLQGYSYKEAKAKAEVTLQRVGLGDRMNNRPNQLSGGQQQRVAIARALVTNSPLILADEPTGALDRKTGLEILDFLIELNKEGKTILLITHDINIANKTSRIIRIEDGILI